MWVDHYTITGNGHVMFWRGCESETSARSADSEGVSLESGRACGHVDGLSVNTR